MRHADSTTDLTSSPLPNLTRALITGSVHNRQSLEWHEKGEGDPTVASLRYGTIDRERPDRRHYSNFADDFPDLDIETILGILGFDDENETLRFQLESWRSLKKRYQLVGSNEYESMVISAPTGFGKTAAFMGQMFHMLTDTSHSADSAILVYPSRALLQDQLSRALDIVDNIRGLDLDGRAPSIGVWSGDIPHSSYKVTKRDGPLTTSNAGPHGGYELSQVGHWNTDLDDTSLYVRKVDDSSGDSYSIPETWDDDSQEYEVYSHDESVIFQWDDLVLHRDLTRKFQSDDSFDRPQVLFTTLEALESIALKPHYDISDSADFFIFDEIHQYTGLRGAHAANIVRNIQWTREQSDIENNGAVFVGASATVSNPAKFAGDLFDADEADDVGYIRPLEVDIDHENEDKQHYYFLLTPNDKRAPKAASQYIQQALLIGHSLLEQSDGRSKMLTFIDSISQINRLRQQIIDAKRDRLWTKHTDIENGDWKHVSDIADREFITSFGDPVPIYADSDYSIADVVDADIVHTTSFLEIGVDIGSAEFIGQYRPPRDLTTFRQRAGRAGRSKGDHSHILTMLSSYNGDTNFFYRADRFLEGDIHTPLNVENDVIAWIHERYRSVYRGLKNSREQYGPQRYYKPVHESDTLQKVFVDQLDYDIFYKFLTEPDDIFRTLIDQPGPSYALYRSDAQSNALEEAYGAIDKAEGEAQKELRAKAELIGVDDEAGGDDRLESIDQASGALKVGDNIEQLLSPLQKPIDDGYINDETAEVITSVLSQVRNLDARPPGKRIDDLYDVYSSLLDEYMDIETALQNTEYENRGYELSDIQEIEETLDVLNSGDLSKYQDDLYVIHYLKRALDNVDDYLKFKEEYGTPHTSLLAYKHLLRSAYYLNKALYRDDGQPSEEVRISTKFRDDPGAEFWYVPEDYFDNSGRYFSLVEQREENGERVETEESVDNLIRKYIPYKTEYLEETGQLQTFRPSVIKQDDDEFVLAVGEEVEGYEYKGIFHPDEIELREIRDYSGEEAEGVYALDPETYKLLTPEEVESRHDDPQYAKLFSRANLRTEIENLSDGAAIGNLQYGELDGKVWIDSITLEPRAQDPNVTLKDRTIPTDRKLGYTLETQGIEWELSDYIERLFNTEKGKLAIEQAQKFKSFEKYSETESALITASHFLTLLIADVTGVKPGLLLHGFDKSSKTVFVFDQTQGGQGIIELFFDEIEENPAAVLDSVYRLLHNSQVLNESLWGNEGSSGTPTWKKLRDIVSIEAIEKGGDDLASQREQIERIAESQLNISYENSLSRVSEEAISTVERIHSLSDDAGIDVERFYELKHELAAARLGGSQSDMIPEEIKNTYQDIFSSDGITEETIRNLLYSPDIDGCQANLHLQTTMIEGKQGEVLSYRLLTQLREEIVTRVDRSEAETLLNDGKYWGRSTDDFIEYLGWGE